MIKYRIHEVAKDFDLPTKKITEIVTEFFAPPKNHMQVLTEEELNLIFDYVTQTNQIESIAKVFETAAKPEEKPAEPAPE
ncbi:MAG: translation initiation factor IF-2 N-terminal domain-containing protein, partial [Oscillospiraceae bacterium]|nr:translation initiation factor IF-2 N-terminal domain-containing protein [Oscillospiraceae bacterium]